MPLLLAPCYGFPSPAGSSYFSMVRFRVRISRTHQLVSVPCGVFVFLNGRRRKHDEVNGFPSPAGSSYFSIDLSRLHTHWFIVSVPCGVFVFLNCLTTLNVSSHRSRFRPLRGLRISQWRTYKLRYRNENGVSVPCGVFVFLNRKAYCYLIG